VKLHIGGTGSGASVEAWVDDIVYYVDQRSSTCSPAIEVQSVPTVRRSCYDHYVAGARTNGVYRIDR
jgi:hypothetical protein